MNRQLGVGLLGGGPVTQAIHLPTLANLGDRFRVVSVMDIDEEVARRVADRCDATSTGDATAVIDDPDVDVVAVCSPNAAHAAQVVASCEAGKRRSYARSHSPSPTPRRNRSPPQPQRRAPTWSSAPCTSTTRPTGQPTRRGGANGTPPCSPSPRSSCPPTNGSSTRPPNWRH